MSSAGLYVTGSIIGRSHAPAFGTLIATTQAEIIVVLELSRLAICGTFQSRISVF